jgi:hypothetical protein
LHPGRIRGLSPGRNDEGTRGSLFRKERRPRIPSHRVGEEGFEPSRPFGHTDLNRARLPFRHPPFLGAEKQ